MEYIKNLIHQRVTLLCLLLTCNFAVASAASISGTVVSAQDKSPVIGAAVTVTGTVIGTSTDIDGAFTLTDLPDSGEIAISYIGYTTQTMPIVNGKKYTVELASDTKAIEEVVVVGYGTMRKKEVTGAVARVDAETLSKMNTSDVGSALQGQVAGVNVQMSSGQPGEVANIQIRGISSINGANTPLYVVDGIPYDGDPGLSPSEIESIDILKDAASAAIYGTRGSGGVILITTKGGKEGKMSVNVDANYGVQLITSRLYLTDTAQEIAVNALQTELSDNIPSNEAWQKIKENQTGFADESNMAQILEQDLQSVSNVTLNVSGGAKGATYSVIGNYFSQDGVIINSGYERLNIRANTQLKRNNWTFSANLSTNINEKEEPASGIYNQIYSYKPSSPIFNPDLEVGTTPGTDTNEKVQMGNVLAKFKESNTTQNKGFNGTFAIGYDFLEGLNFTSRLGTGYNAAVKERINPLFNIYDEDGELVPNTNTRSGIFRQTQNTTKFVWENMLNYGVTLGKHDIKATAVLSMEKYFMDMFNVEKYDLISNDLTLIESTTGETVVNSDRRTTTLYGMLGRAQYSYDDRYMVSASIRRDASSRFGSKNRWGSFPSVSAGWNVSEESFFEPLRNSIDMLKIRASYGTTGNQNFADYQYSASIENVLDYAFGGQGGTSIDYGAIQTAYANSDVKWETTQQLNAGIDLALLNSRLTITGDVYQTTKRDMLLSLQIPPSAGTTSAVILNVGDMENKGVELALGWKDGNSNFRYNANLTVSRNVNTITAMSGTNKSFALGKLDNQFVTYLRESYEAGAYFLYPTNGVINTEEKLKEYAKMKPEATMGDLMYVDTDGNGSIGEEDRIYYGSGAPEVEFGLSAGAEYKGFDFSMQWYASIGNEVINGSKYQAYKNKRHLDLLSSWTPYNAYSPIPRIQANASHDNYLAYSDYWLDNGSYIRLNNVVLGYTIPKASLMKVGISKLRVYVAADNIWTITKYDGYNPGVGNDGLKTRGVDAGTYPVAAQIRGGVQLNF